MVDQNDSQDVARFALVGNDSIDFSSALCSADGALPLPLSNLGVRISAPLSSSTWIEDTLLPDLDLCVCASRQQLWHLQRHPYAPPDSELTSLDHIKKSYPINILGWDSEPVIPTANALASTTRGDHLSTLHPAGESFWHYKSFLERSPSRNHEQHLKGDLRSDQLYVVSGMKLYKNLNIRHLHIFSISKPTHKSSALDHLSLPRNFMLQTELSIVPSDCIQPDSPILEGLKMTLPDVYSDTNTSRQPGYPEESSCVGVVGRSYDKHSESHSERTNGALGTPNTHHSLDLSATNPRKPPSAPNMGTAKDDPISSSFYDAESNPTTSTKTSVPRIGCQPGHLVHSDNLDAATSEHDALESGIWIIRAGGVSHGAPTTDLHPYLTASGFPTLSTYAVANWPN
ncbi:hypothetical protein DL93DRAFT_2165116 [Clavulina sp. PMI_390]|nr:hypothetical protein DL93DRAFT_2165116 [Clavulina sp. PMI_390]